MGRQAGGGLGSLPSWLSLFHREDGFLLNNLAWHEARELKKKGPQACKKEGQNATVTSGLIAGLTLHSTIGR